MMLSLTDSFRLAVLLAGLGQADGRKIPEAIASSNVAPHLQFRVTQGTVSPKQVLSCTAGRMDHPYQDHTDKALVFTCDGDLRLELNNMYFDGKVDLVVERVYRR